jgi:hypothetical protein
VSDYPTTIDTTEVTKCSDCGRDRLTSRSNQCFSCQRASERIAATRRTIDGIVAGTECAYVDICIRRMEARIAKESS